MCAGCRVIAAATSCRTNCLCSFGGEINTMRMSECPSGRDMVAVVLDIAAGRLVVPMPLIDEACRCRRVGCVNALIHNA